VFDADKVASSFALFDAMRVAQGPIALLRLKEPIHLGFHACFEARECESG
jgi:carotenoid cleavage dioxygenase-like enzyme